MISGWKITNKTKSKLMVRSPQQLFKVFSWVLHTSKSLHTLDPMCFFIFIRLMKSHKHNIPKGFSFRIISKIRQSCFTNKKILYLTCFIVLCIYIIKNKNILNLLCTFFGIIMPSASWTVVFFLMKSFLSLALRSQLRQMTQSLLAAFLVRKSSSANGLGLRSWQTNDVWCDRFLWLFGT